MWDLSTVYQQFLPKHKNTHHKGGLGLFVYPNIVCIAAFLAIGGCSGTTRDTDSPTLNEYGEQAQSVLSPDSGGKAAGGEWSIVLSRVASGRADHAEMMLGTIQQQGGLGSAYIDERSNGVVIAYGHYTGSDDPRAKSELKRVRAMTLNGGTPFAGAYLAPPSRTDLQGSNAEFDLRNVKSRVGENAVYTLQIGVYGSDNLSTPTAGELAEFRRAAELAVVNLRAENVEAFYYHGASRSMVTVGVFSRDDYDATVTPAIESSPLRDARKRFPHNTLNGMGIRETVMTEQGRTKRMQRSQLVEIPKG